VTAVDLRGHGASERAEHYAPADYAADVVETAKEFGAIDLAIGHSLGGLALAYAVEELRPAKAVYVDPAWRIGSRAEGFDAAGTFVAFADTATAETVSSANPAWSAEDIEIELATLRVWDRETARKLPGSAATVGPPQQAVVPSLILLPDSGSLITCQDIEALAGRGFEIRTVPGVGHTMHRDDLEAVLAALDGWA
jgi:pimeloyl-ACP methyl ester carboxylesterase